MLAEISQDVPTVLLSYDVSGEARSLAVRVCHLVFGRSDAPASAPPAYVLRPGVVWVGQSVLLLPKPLADELASRLRRHGVSVSTAIVRIEPAELSAFRRRRPQPGIPGGRTRKLFPRGPPLTRREGSLLVLGGPHGVRIPEPA